MITAILTILFAIIGASIVWNVIGTVGRIAVICAIVIWVLVKISKKSNEKKTCSFIIMKLQVFLRFLKVLEEKNNK